MFLIFKIYFKKCIPVIKAEFSASLLQSHDVQRYSDLLLKIHLLLLLLCIMKQLRRFFFQVSLMNRKFRRTALSEIEIFCNIINVFIIIFDQFKSILAK